MGKFFALIPRFVISLFHYIPLRYSLKDNNTVWEGGGGIPAQIYVFFLNVKSVQETRVMFKLVHVFQLLIAHSPSDDLKITILCGFQKICIAFGDIRFRIWIVVIHRSWDIRENLWYCVLEAKRLPLKRNVTINFVLILGLYW